MKRRNFLISGVAGVAVGLIPILGFSEKKDSLRKIERLVPCDGYPGKYNLETCSMKDIRKGDRFMMHEPSGEPVVFKDIKTSFADDASVLIAKSDAVMVVCDGVEVWGVDSEDSGWYFYIDRHLELRKQLEFLVGVGC